MKRVLMVAYHFPPLAGSSGIQRTLRFARYLPENGWQPIVLTAHTRAYEQLSTDQLDDIPAGVEVIRSQAWDTARHLSIAGRYPGVLARPDRWASWWPAAVISGLKAIKRLKPDLIWSTYPIATAHRIGASLAVRSGLPWVADFRDPMAQEGYPSDPATWRSYLQIERQAISLAHTSTFTTPSALRDYQNRYPSRAGRMELLENGYDEETFADPVVSTPLNPGRLTLLHSGIVYPSERDPTHLFAALAQLRAKSPALAERLVLRFRAPVHDALLNRLSVEHSVQSMVQIEPPVPYRVALTEMRQADALLILQAANCNAQIPAKLYEYLRAGVPIIALTDKAGDTALTLRGAGVDAIAALDVPDAIATLLVAFARDPAAFPLANHAKVQSASRQGRSSQLAALFEHALEPS